MLFEQLVIGSDGLADLGLVVLAKDFLFFRELLSQSLLGGGKALGQPEFAPLVLFIQRHPALFEAGLRLSEPGG